MDERDYTVGRSSLDGSHSSSTRKPPQSVAPVAKAEIEKKSFGRRLRDYLFAGNMQDLKTYIISDIIVPNVKDLISEMVGRGIDMLLYNDSRPRRSVNSSSSIRQASRSSLGNAYINYNDTSRRNRSARDRINEDNVAELEDGYLTWATRAKATDVRDGLLNILDEYEVVSLANYYQLAEWEPESTDFNYGWYNLSTLSEPIRTRTGRYRLELPKAVSLIN